MAIGYDAGYYSYLWSDVIAHDLYGAFKQHVPSADGGATAVGDHDHDRDAATASRPGGGGGCLDPAVGARFRACVLAPAATRDGAAMVRWGLAPLAPLPAPRKST